MVPTATVPIVQHRADGKDLLPEDGCLRKAGVVMFLSLPVSEVVECGPSRECAEFASRQGRPP
jgi:hypothetical protein